MLRAIWSAFCSTHCVSCAVELTLTPGDSMKEWCPLCPVLGGPAQLLSTHAYGVFYGVCPFHIWSSSFVQPPFSPASWSFPENSVFYDRLKIGQLQFYHYFFLFALMMFQVLFALGPTCLPFWWSRVHGQLSSKTIFQMNCFFSISLLHCPTSMFVHSNWEYQCVDDLSLDL